MTSELDEEFWNRLLSRIEAQAVIPIVGPGAITCGVDDSLLHNWLAAQISDKYKLGLPEETSQWQQVVEALRQSATSAEEKNERVSFLHSDLFSLVTRSHLQPGITLCRLAGIKDFQLFLTTAFDPLLEHAVSWTQPASRPKDWVGYISHRDGNTDLPDTYGNLPYACVYHLFGRIRRIPDCALWDDEALDFLRRLDQHIAKGGRLARALLDAHLLFLGLRLDNWLLRFLVQIAKGERVTRLGDKHLYLSDAFVATEYDQVVAYFSPLTDRLRILPLAPRDFISELAKRWHDRRGNQPNDVTFMKEAHRLAHSAKGCIFLSYASPDLPIAEYVVRQLQRAGLLVWYDKQQLQPGQDWEAEFSTAVEEKCGLFLSLISDVSAQRLSAYNILERKLAAKRRDRFADNAVFYIPIRIDEGEPLIPENEPRGTKKIQGIRKPGGHLDDDLIEYLRKVQLEYCKCMDISFTSPPILE